MASQLTSGSVCRDDVKQLVENLNIFTLDTHSFVESSGSLKPLDLPLVDSPTAGFLKCFVDIITDVSAFPKTEIKQALVSKKIHELPAPYGLTQKIDTPTKIDIAVINQNNGTFCVVKIVNLSEKTKVSRVQNLCYGKCQAVDWVGDIKAVKKCLHYLFECLGGFQCRQHVLRIREEGKPEADRTPEEWDYGFDFIQDHGPRENIKNRQLRWITKEIARKDSPIYKWSPVLVEKSLRNLAQDGVLSQVHEVWPLTLYDLDIRILRALEPLIPTLVEKAVGFHGLPGAGKTPVARTLAMAISRYWIHKARKDGEIRPSFRQACEFDFFRGQAGSLMRPDIFDDGTLSDQPFRKVKAFTDVGNIESMSKERQEVHSDVLNTISLKYEPISSCAMLSCCAGGVLLNGPRAKPASTASMNSKRTRSLNSISPSSSRPKAFPHMSPTTTSSRCWNPHGIPRRTAMQTSWPFSSGLTSS